MCGFLDGKRKLEPLHVVYSIKLFPKSKKAFVKGKHSVLASVYEMKDVVVVDVSEIRKLDPEMINLRNQYVEIIKHFKEPSKRGKNY